MNVQIEARMSTFPHEANLTQNFFFGEKVMVKTVSKFHFSVSI